MRFSTILLSALLLAAPSPLLAQNLGGGDDWSASARTDRGDWLDNPRLGLLGLLGLGGLLRLIRREPSIHVDARRKREHRTGD